MMYDRFGNALYQEQDETKVSPMEACNALYKEWEKYKYGIPYKKEIIDIPDEPNYFDKHYKFLSPEKFQEYGGGVCWDYVEFGDAFLREKNVEPKKYYIWTETPPNWTTHTFLVVEDNGKFIYVESSFAILKGVKTYNSLDEIINVILKNIFKCEDNGRRFNQFNYKIFDFTGTHPPYGCTCKQYMYWIPQNCECVKEGTIQKNDQPVQESVFHRLKELGKKYHPELVQEAKLSKDDKEKMDDDVFGIPELRKYPMPDKKHVIKAVQFFNKAPDDYKEELARNIVKRAKELDMEWENWDTLKPYLKDEEDDQDDKQDEKVQESAVVTSTQHIKITVEDLKKLASQIHEKTVKDAHSGPGNQNCELCTWCMELNLRRIAMDEFKEPVLPRAVYSPRDQLFNHKGEEVIKNPHMTTFKFRSKKDLILKMKEYQSRWYVHVNWKDSSGGHEFLCINIDGEIYLVDAQEGLVLSLDNPKSNNYFDINFDNSYMVRLDLSPFNYDLFEKMNSESSLVPWDPKKDIPYMKEHNMLSEEDLKQIDEYQIDIIDDNDIFQEWGWQDIRNGVNPHSKKLFFHVTSDKDLDDKELKPRVPTWIHDIEGDPEKVMKDTGRYEDIKTPRVCFSPSIEGCLNSIMNIHKITKKEFGSQQLYVFIPEKPIDQYKHKTNKEIQHDGDVFDAGTTGEMWILEPVKLKFYGTIQVDQVKDNGKSYPVIMQGGKKSKNDKIGRYTYKWHWLIHPSVQKKMDQYEKENAEEEANKKKEG